MTHDTPGPARLRHAHRARHAARRAVRRAAARRHGRRGDQDRAARASPTRCANGARRATRAAPCWWPVQARNKKCITLNLREPRGPGAPARARRASRDVAARELPAGHARALEPRLRPAARRRNPGIVLARISGYGQTGPYAERAGFASRRGGDGRAPLHQRLPGRGAAAHRHLARRLARRDVRRAGHPGGALPPRRARRRPRARSSTSR